MTTTRIYQNGNEQALQIPQEMKAEQIEYCINKIGNVYIVYPASDPWAPLREVMGTFPENFMSNREKLSWEEIPERENL